MDILSSLDIIIVNWNTGNQLRECLESIATANQAGFSLNRVVVVDNASADGSLEGLDDLDLPLILIKNKENVGFAAACNQGAKGSKSDYLLFLNPDTRLFEDSLRLPVSFTQRPENEKIGICGIQLVEENGSVARTCARFPTPSMFFSKMFGLDRLFPRVFPSHNMAEWDHMNSRLVDHVIGAFFLVRRSLFNIINGFDERFFVYLEDLDFSLRARQAGYSSYYLAGAQAYHKGGGTSEQVKAQRLFYSLRSRILYGYKHFGKSSAIALMTGTLLIEPWTRLVWAMGRLSLAEAKETAKSFGLLWREMPAMLTNVFMSRVNHERER